jgi:hypothetical protein
MLRRETQEFRIVEYERAVVQAIDSLPMKSARSGS